VLVTHGCMQPSVLLTSAEVAWLQNKEKTRDQVLLIRVGQMTGQMTDKKKKGYAKKVIKGEEKWVKS
jgi:hypothetical protein